MILEHDDEPIPGLPERLPAGERILWQGAPDWRALARRVFWTRVVAIYFALFATWSAIDALEQGAGIADALASASAVAIPAAAAMGILYLLAYITARSTLYTITNRRVAMRVGVAMQIIVNLPFAKLSEAQLAPLWGGTGDIALKLTPDGRFAYLTLWPHARPWAFGHTQPSLRCVPEAAHAAALLAEAVAAVNTSVAPAPPEAAAPPTPSRPEPLGALGLAGAR